jgi:hypothetical protein
MEVKYRWKNMVCSIARVKVSYGLTETSGREGEMRSGGEAKELKDKVQSRKQTHPSQHPSHTPGPRRCQCCTRGVVVAPC